jgi:hypothetical protein
MSGFIYKIEIGNFLMYSKIRKEAHDIFPEPPMMTRDSPDIPLKKVFILGSLTVSQSSTFLHFGKL